MFCSSVARKASRTILKRCMACPSADLFYRLNRWKVMATQTCATFCLLRIGAARRALLIGPQPEASPHHVHVHDHNLTVFILNDPHHHRASEYAHTTQPSLCKKKADIHRQRQGDGKKDAGRHGDRDGDTRRPRARHTQTEQNMYCAPPRLVPILTCLVAKNIDMKNGACNMPANIFPG